MVPLLSSGMYLALLGNLRKARRAAFRRVRRARWRETVIDQRIEPVLTALDERTSTECALA
jgi:hypothetical protein